MTILVLILLALAGFCFLLAAAGMGGRVNLVALGLLLWVLAPICQYVNRL